MTGQPPATYQSAGVATDLPEGGLGPLRSWIEKTFAFGPRPDAVKLPLGYYANVIDIGGGQGLAVATDGVGTKILVAEMAGRYDTIGIDCVAMNANDIVCVGAEPVALVDYVAVEKLDPAVLGELARGLCRGAELANVSIPGGELAQIAEMIRGVKKGGGLDLVGTCVGVVPLDRILIGQDVREGDLVVGLYSSGIHSNGYTLARRVLFDRQGWSVETRVEELGRTLGEELLEPTRIYVRPAVAMLKAGLAVKAFCHVTGDGLLNLTRVAAEAGFVLDALPEPPAVFRLIQKCGEVEDAEMYRVFNMGVGFCVVVAPAEADRVLEIARRHDCDGQVIGAAVHDPQRRILLTSLNLVGRAGRFQRE